jgi:hypothetical protein
MKIHQGMFKVRERERERVQYCQPYEMSDGHKNRETLYRNCDFRLLFGG